ncbi:unnamed protein product [Vitrella brassicaformis CCMP3155]|uniref:EF-hand domain-containing protein n=1 Tax=Vitrella brassicaformis (strain CCMP3155) TaxID=1169540 RepID=A0A0G4FD64_VITBC|nr:unnamed protein product [Vitrella brassicaformis CCMP3155]|eukprot:CEM10854.1 unnamed protein product [Vitrella brassicaformis CCMP3155]
MESGAGGQQLEETNQATNHSQVHQAAEPQIDQTGEVPPTEVDKAPEPSASHKGAEPSASHKAAAVSLPGALWRRESVEARARWERLGLDTVRFGLVTSPVNWLIWGALLLVFIYYGDLHEDGTEKYSSINEFVDDLTTPHDNYTWQKARFDKIVLSVVWALFAFFTLQEFVLVTLFWRPTLIAFHNRTLRQYIGAGIRGQHSAVDPSSEKKTFMSRVRFIIAKIRNEYLGFTGIVFWILHFADDFADIILQSRRCLLYGGWDVLTWSHVPALDWPTHVVLSAILCFHSVVFCGTFIFKKRGLAVILSLTANMLYISHSLLIVSAILTTGQIGLGSLLVVQSRSAVDFFTSFMPLFLAVHELKALDNLLKLKSFHDWQKHNKAVKEKHRISVATVLSPDALVQHKHPVSLPIGKATGAADPAAPSTQAADTTRSTPEAAGQSASNSGSPDEFPQRMPSLGDAEASVRRSVGNVRGQLNGLMDLEGFLSSYARGEIEEKMRERRPSIMEKGVILPDTDLFADGADEKFRAIEFSTLFGPAEPASPLRQRRVSIASIKSADIDSDAIPKSERQSVANVVDQLPESHVSVAGAGESRRSSNLVSFHEDKQRQTSAEVTMLRVEKGLRVVTAALSVFLLGLFIFQVTQLIRSAVLCRRIDAWEHNCVLKTRPPMKGSSPCDCRYFIVDLQLNPVDGTRLDKPRSKGEMFHTVVEGLNSFESLEGLTIYAFGAEETPPPRSTTVPDLTKQPFLVEIVWTGMAFTTWENPDFSRLPRLRGLVFAIGALTEMPESICSLKDLSWLDMSGQAFTSIPTCVADLKELHVFRLLFNPLCNTGFLQDPSHPPNFKEVLEKLKPCGGAPQTGSSHCGTTCADNNQIFLIIDANGDKLLCYDEVSKVQPWSEAEFLAMLYDLQSPDDPVGPCAKWRSFQLIFSQGTTDCMECPFAVESAIEKGIAT